MSQPSQADATARVLVLVALILYQALELLLTTRITQAHGTEGEDGERVGRAGFCSVVAVPLRGQLSSGTPVTRCL